MSPLTLVSLPAAAQHDPAAHPHDGASGGAAPGERRAATVVALLVMALSVLAACYAG